MNASVIDIGRYARVPYHVATAKISSRAREVWMLLAMNGSPQSPEVWVRQPTLTEQLSCSTDTIGRALRVLIRQGLIAETGKWHQGRHKIYRLSWSALSREGTTPGTATSPNVVPRKCNTTLRIPAAVPSAKVRVEVPQKCRSLIRVLEEYKKINFRESEEEREWIVTTIKQSLEQQRKKEKLDAKLQSRFFARGQLPSNSATTTAPSDEIISCETHPIMWAFLRIRWADKLQRLAA